MKHGKQGASSRRGLTWVIGSCLVVVALLCGGYVGYLTLGTGTEETVSDMAGNQVKPDDDQLASPAQVKAAKVVNLDKRFTIPSVGLNVPLSELSPVKGVVVPPGFKEAYSIRQMGASPDQAKSGTVFVVMHSLRHGGKAPGNYLIDVPKGKSALPMGTTVTVGNFTYTVNGSQVVPKSKLPEAKSVWENTPGRLVLITCLQRPSGKPSTDNLVVTAELKA